MTFSTAVAIGNEQINDHTASEIDHQPGVVVPEDSKVLLPSLILN
jgi:hypothetical protein